MLYLDKLQGTHVVTVTGARVGSQIDPHCNAVGKVLLADRDAGEVRRLLEGSPLRAYTPSTVTDVDAFEDELNRVRVQGYAYDRAEAVADVHCVAAGIRDETGGVVAAMSMTVSSSRFAVSHREYRRVVVAAASAVSHRLVAAEQPKGGPVRPSSPALAAAASSAIRSRRRALVTRRAPGVSDRRRTASR